MATSEGSPSRWKGASFQRSLGASRAVAQAILSLTEKEPQKRWPTFPMGLRSKGTFRSASSYLLHQLIHRSHEAEVEQEEQQEEGESEESQESEMQNLEVCLPLPPTPHPSLGLPLAAQPGCLSDSLLLQCPGFSPLLSAQRTRAFLRCLFLFPKFLASFPPVLEEGGRNPPNIYFLFMVGFNAFKIMH